ncbi:LAGLIDADG family homing endonuclease [Hyphomicrobium sp.]|uniref:LAGLIDADG family homing endonuclease n=1 Tax=Hyphomicrobium sp. TaxID=82 RepID=UPI003F703D78
MTDTPDFLAPISEEIWRLKYRFEGESGGDETLADTFRRVAKAAASVEKGKRARARWSETFYDSLSDFGFLPAGRILAGAGTGRAVTLFNCFVMGRIDDDLGAIFENVKEAALTMQQGGGIGHDFSTLRPRGARVKSIGADASGPVSFMDVWDSMCRTIMSAGQRRGAMMGTLACDHPDIEAFIDAKSDPARLRNFNLSVLVTDAFIAAVRADRPWDLVFGGTVVRTVRARDLWRRLMRAAYDYAEPGVIFIDRVNARNNLSYCEEIRATNPCVTADTWVHTGLGPRQVSDLIGTPFTARVDGEDWHSETGFFKTGRKPVVKLQTKDGFTVRLTGDHKVLAVGSLTRDDRTTTWREARSLRPGESVVLSNHRPNAEWGGPETFEQGYLLGLLIGDGTLKQDGAVLSVWKPLKVGNGDSGPHGVDGVMAAAERAARTLRHRADFVGWFEVAGRSEWRLKLAALRDLAGTFGMMPGDKHIAPRAEQTSSAFHRGLLRGFFDTDGSVQGTQLKGASVRLAQSDLPRLEAVQRMLARLGICAKLYRNRRTAGARKMPDGKGGIGLYPAKAHHELVIAGDNLAQFAARVGFSDEEKSRKLAIILASYSRSLNRERFCAEVHSVEPDGEADVYDVSVPGRNAFDAGGLIVHNCGEQPLPPYGACLLGSINLAELVTQPFEANAAIATAALEQRVQTAIRFLDNVIDVSGYPLPAQREEAKSKRRIGLGVTGLADALIAHGVRYGTPEAEALAQSWMAVIERSAYLASAELAAEKGAFPLYDKKRFLASPNVARLPEDVREAIARNGIRNGCLTSIAPTGTISLFAGNVSSGVEPVFDFRYTRRVLGKDGAHRIEEVEDLAHARFRRAHGADAALGRAFVSAADLTPHEHLVMQAALQRHVDSSISKTINCPPDISFEAFETIYLEAFDLGLKGCTAYRPNDITGAILAPISSPVVEQVEAEEAERAAATALPASTLPLAVPAMPAAARHGDIVYMTQPLERDPVLAGYTYKIKWPESDHAIYVTLNDIDSGGRRRPFEIFINTRNLEHYAWTVALTRMISAVFRRGGDVSFVAHELKAVFDPQGGRWIGGRYVPSLLAAIGEVIETHMRRIGFMTPDDAQDVPATTSLASVGERGSPGASTAGGGLGVHGGRSCPRCAAQAFIKESGCWTCRACGFSRCD